MKRFLFSFIFLFSTLVHATAVQHIVSAKITTGASSAQHLGTSVSNINQVLQCSGTTGTGAGTATVKLQGSNDNANWIDLATCTLTLATTISTSSATNTAQWLWYRVNVTALTGTGASVDAYVSY